MKAIVFTGNKRLDIGKGAKPAIVEYRPLEALKLYRPDPRSVAYVDVQGLEPAELRKALAALKRRSDGGPWGVLDAKGAAPDPASFFHDGAVDYLGASLCREGLSKQRLKAALDYYGDDDCGDPDAEEAPAFPGWKALKPGESSRFFFLYFSVEGNAKLKTRLGESGYIAFRERLRAFMQQAFAEADPLLWMENESNGLFLVPPTEGKARAAVVACLRLLLETPLVCYEKLGLPFALSFVFALHAGQTAYEAPGRTGTIVSDAVNYIFHLGSKRATGGRLFISDDAQPAVPDRLADLFLDAGFFEGKAIRASRRFGA